MKRFLSILLAVAMTISMVLPVFAASYTDTAGNDYEAAIEHLTGLGVIDGYEDGSYKPEGIVTRAEMAKLLVEVLGLESGADILTGESEFVDVPTSHWAIGYINVATQYGLIKGDGDGNFRPNDPVNYAEAATMALRALNYQTVIEKAGQWPTNYVNKANELKLFEDVETMKVSDGAKRGAVAQILWNMLNTKMWEVVSESEGDGLTSTSNRDMIEVKFANYAFEELLTYTGYEVKEINNKLEVVLSFNGVAYTEKDPVTGVETTITPEHSYAYDGNDFYKFVPGTEFETIIHDEKYIDRIVTFLVAEDNYLAEGTAKDLCDKYEALDDNFDDITTETESSGIYAYVLLNGPRSTADANAVLEYNSANSLYVEEIKQYTDEIAFTDGVTTTDRYDEDAVAETLVLIDGERKTVNDIAVGDVITEITELNEDDEEVSKNLILVARGDKAEGVVTKYVAETKLLTVADAKYYLEDTATVIVEPDDEDSEAEKIDVANIDDYEDQTAIIYKDFIGNVVRVEFAEIVDIEKGDAGVFVIANDAWMISDENGAIYKIKLTNMNGETAAYTFEEDSAAKSTADMKNNVVWVQFNKDGEIETITNIVAFTEKEEKVENELPVEVAITKSDLYNEKDADEYKADKLDKDEYYKVKQYTTVALNDNYLAEDAATKDHKVTDSTKLVKLGFDYNEKTDKVTYTVEVKAGVDAVKSIKDEAAVVIYSGDFESANYVIAWGDTIATDLMSGVVTNVEVNAVTGETEVTIDGKEYVKASGKATKGAFVAFVLNEDGEFVGEEEVLPNDFVGAAKVTAKEGKRFMMDKAWNGLTSIDLEDEDIVDKFADANVVVVTVDYKTDSKLSALYSGYEIIDYKVTDFDSISVSKDNYIGISEDGESIVVYKLTTAAEDAVKAAADAE